jgi:hypothetical protein
LIAAARQLRCPAKLIGRFGENGRDAILTRIRRAAATLRSEPTETLRLATARQDAASSSRAVKPATRERAE